jgi:hypothetical protein
MISSLRQDFNSRRFSPERYGALLARLGELTHSPIGFRVSETPCFLPESLLNSIAEAGAELTHQLVDSPEYQWRSLAAIPSEYRVPHDNPHPHFMTVDFGLVRNEEGVLAPKLVELQAFPSIYGFQAILSREYVTAFDLDPNLRWFFNGHDDASYWRLLARVIVGHHAPENVVLLEVDPESQKTLPDFRAHEDRLGIRAVDITSLVKQGRKLLYHREGRLTPIHRIYNRAIVDEIVRKGIELPFDYRDDLEVEWAGHPNWYFRISKFSLPFLNHPTVPPAIFLDDWFSGKGRDRLPGDPASIILKPLYSFAGKGIQFAPSEDDLRSIPVSERHNYLLQERVHFTPVIDAPPGPTQVEIRIMYLWPDGEPLQPVLSLLRMGRGLMMGVDHNRRMDWVGASAGLFPPGS